MSIKLSNLIRVGTEELETTNPVFNLTKPLFDTKEDKINKNKPNGYLGLDQNGNIPNNISGGSGSGGYGGGDLIVDGHILPDQTQLRNIGSENSRFNNLYVDDLHLSGNTLYLGETPILGTDSDTVVIKTDLNQHLSLQTTGIGTTQLTSQKEVSIITTGMNADVLLQASGDGSKVRLGSQSPIELTGSLNISNNLTVSGNLNINGTQTVVNSTVVQVKDNVLVLNYGEIGNGVTAGTSGIRVDRGEEVDYLFIYDESVNRFRVGKQGDLETVASQPWCQEHFAVSDHTHGENGESITLVTTTTNGLMSYQDKIKLNSIDEEADKTTKNKVESVLTGTIWSHIHPTINGTLNFNNLLLIEDRKLENINSGTFEAGDWRIRDLNTVVINNIVGADLEDNSITLLPGVYYVEIDIPANEVNSHVGCLYNKTDEVVILYGTSSKEISKICGHFVINKITKLEILNKCEVTKEDNGFGYSNNLLNIPYNIFTVCKFWLIANDSTYVESGYVTPGYVV